jgi:phage regulator Rha-like protein
MGSTSHGAMPGVVTPELTLTIVKNEPLVDTRLLAMHLGNQHQSLFKLISNYKSDFEELGILRFQIGLIDGRGQPEKFALLNDGQSYLALTFSKNTAKVRQLKVKLVKAFLEATKAVNLRQTEYLPIYHALHDQIKVLAAGSQNERFMHMNVNKATNKAAGLEAGQRNNASLPQQSMLIVAQSVALQAAQGAADRHELQRRVKVSLAALTAATMLEVSNG